MTNVALRPPRVAETQIAVYVLARGVTEPLLLLVTGLVLSSWYDGSVALPATLIVSVAGGGAIAAAALVHFVRPANPAPNARAGPSVAGARARTALVSARSGRCGVERAGEARPGRGRDRDVLGPSDHRLRDRRRARCCVRCDPDRVRSDRGSLRRRGSRRPRALDPHRDDGDALEPLTSGVPIAFAMLVAPDRTPRSISSAAIAHRACPSS